MIPRVIFTFLTALALIGNAEPVASEIYLSENSTCADVDRLVSSDATHDMGFRAATTKGAAYTSNWIAASGVITAATPDRLRAFLAEDPHSNIVLHSTGGNLFAGLEVGRIIREHGMTAHIGKTVREYFGDAQSETCWSFGDGVFTGVCFSACAYAFLGGEPRFIDSPNYPTFPESTIGFHQFYSDYSSVGSVENFDSVSLLSSVEVETQLTAGAIALYLVEMGVDGRVFSLAALMGPNEIYTPSQSEVADLRIATLRGLGDWELAPYRGGLIAFSKDQTPRSGTQITMFCRDESPEQLRLLFTYATGWNGPLDGAINGASIVDLQTGAEHALRLHSARKTDGTVMLEIVVNPQVEVRFKSGGSLRLIVDGVRSLSPRISIEIGSMTAEKIAILDRACIP